MNINNVDEHRQIHRWLLILWNNIDEMWMSNACYR
jgi:hypothetical protein